MSWKAHQTIWMWNSLDFNFNLHPQAEDDSVEASLTSLAEAVSSLGDLTKSTPKRKADPKPKAAKDKKKPRKAWDMVQFLGHCTGFSQVHAWVNHVACLQTRCSTISFQWFQNARMWAAVRLDAVLCLWRCHGNAPAFGALLNTASKECDFQYF